MCIPTEFLESSVVPGAGLPCPRGDPELVGARGEARGPFPASPSWLPASDALWGGSSDQSLFTLCFHLGLQQTQSAVLTAASWAQAWAGGRSSAGLRGGEEPTDTPLPPPSAPLLPGEMPCGLSSSGSEPVRRGSLDVHVCVG